MSNSRRGWVVVLLCWWTTNLWAAVRYVPQEYGSIQSAIQTCANGDSVVVAPRRYLENVNFLGKDITLTSTDPNDPNIVASTIIDANGTGTVVTFANGESRQAILTGFTITGGVGSYDPEFPSILFYLGNLNKAYLGGGILCYHASPSIIGNVVEENHIPTELTIEDDRQTQIDGFGGGIACNHSNALVQGNVIRNNSACFGGGGLHTWQSTAQINGNTFYGNRTERSGGAMFLDSNQGITSNNLCFDNYAQAYGGGVVIVSGATLINNTVAANTSAPNSGGNLFSYNTTYLSDFNPLVLVNNIIAQAPSGYGLLLRGSHPYDVIANNNVWGNQPTDYCETYDHTGINSNISKDPGFIDTAAGNYHLRVDSPCVDAGTIIPTVAALALDIDGVLRLVAESVDMGAYEYPARRLLAQTYENKYLSRPLRVILDGSASSFIDPNGPKLFQWTQIQGPSVELSGADTAIAGFDTPTEGQYCFELVVSDGTRQSQPAQIWVTVLNRAPLAQCPMSWSSVLADVEVILDGSNSYDPDGDSIMYQWSQLAGPTVDLQNADASISLFTASHAGIYTFSLVVNDGLLASSPAEINVIIGNTIPVADPDNALYVHDEPVSLNGLGSYDPDGLLPVDLGYRWRQLSGPNLQIDDPHSPTPTISGMVPGGTVQHCLFELIVDDGSQQSDPATVEVIIVEDFGNHKLNQTNAPFDSSKPTIVAFEGSNNCTNGGAWNRFDNTIWSQKANIFTASYSPPYYMYGDFLISRLSQVAPDYDQPIQIMGFSAGGMIVMDIAKRLNCVYGDRRYAVNRISLFDPGCRNFEKDIVFMRANNITGESCWFDNYYHDNYYYHIYSLNVRFPTPPADHSTSSDWVSRSHSHSWWPNGYFNNGLYGGYYVSVCGDAKNLVLADDSRAYFFERFDASAPYLIHYDANQYPGRLPEPVVLLDPIDPGDGNGVILTCQPSCNAVGYELLLGTDPTAIETYEVLSDTPDAPDYMLTDIPFDSGFWTVRVRDAYGSTIHAEPRPICRAGLSWPVENLRSTKRFTNIQTAIDRSQDADTIVIRPGLYHENIDYGGKDITLRSIDPNDPNIIATTIIHGVCGVSESVVSFDDGESLQSRLAGLCIFGGSEGIKLSYASVTIENCWILKSSSNGISMLNGSIDISGSVLSDHVGSALKMIKEGRSGASATLANCTLTNNGCYGIEADDNCNAVLSNCVIAENRAAGICSNDASLTDSTVYYNGSVAAPLQLVGNISASNCNIQGTWPGVGNVDVDPEFNCLRRDCPGALLVGDRIVLRADYE